MQTTDNKSLYQHVKEAIELACADKSRIATVFECLAAVRLLLLMIPLGARNDPENRELRTALAFLSWLYRRRFNLGLCEVELAAFTQAVRDFKWTRKDVSNSPSYRALLLQSWRAKEE